MNFLLKGMTIPTRRFLSVVILFSSYFAWFFIFYNYFDEFISPGSLGSPWHTAGLVALLASIVASAFIGSSFHRKTTRRKLLLFCLIAGILITVPIPFFQGDEFLVFWGILAGLSFGLGFPSCQAFLSDSTKPEERGRVAGLAILLTFVFVAFSSILARALKNNPIGIFLFLLGIKSIGFLSFALDPIEQSENTPKPWRNILGYRDFNFYSLAFILFMIAAGLVSLLWDFIPLPPDFDVSYQIATLVRLLGLCIFALTAGMVADRIGRKKPIVFGLVLLAAAYALIGLQATSDVFLVTYVLSGFAWGIIMVVYLVVPGDLAFAGSAERFYTVGWVFPLILYVVVEANVIPLPPDIHVIAYVLSIILLIAIFPLWSARETLSESKMRERKLKEHAETVSQIIQEPQNKDE